MKTNFFVFILTILLCLFGPNSILQAQEQAQYISKDVPSNEIIEKNLKGRIIGKTKEQNGEVSVYYMAQGMSGRMEIKNNRLIPLDTGIWLFLGGMGNYIILAK